jgi:hypothetical protein
VVGDRSDGKAAAKRGRGFCVDLHHALHVRCRNGLVCHELNAASDVAIGRGVHVHAENNNNKKKPFYGIPLFFSFLLHHHHFFFFFI